MAHNGHVKLQSSIINCLEACSSAVSCMAGKRWDLLTTVCDSSGRFTSPQLFVQLATIVINVRAHKIWYAGRVSILQDAVIVVPVWFDFMGSTG